MAAVTIGVDPHKGSHTAVAIGGDEMPLGQLRVRACAGQAERLVERARAWPQRTWAVEGAREWGLASAGRRRSGLFLCRNSGSCHLAMRPAGREAWLPCPPGGSCQRA